MKTNSFVGVVIVTFMNYVLFEHKFTAATHVMFQVECPRHIYKNQTYVSTFNLNDTRVDEAHPVDNLYHVNSNDHVNFVCYRYMGANRLPRPAKNPSRVVLNIKRSCTPCDAGHLIPHLHGGTADDGNYFSQDSVLNRGFWAQVERAVLDKPLYTTVVTIQLIYNYKMYPYILPYPPPIKIQALIFDDEGNNNNPYIYQCVNIFNTPYGNESSVPIYTELRKMTVAQLNRCTQ